MNALYFFCRMYLGFSVFAMVVNFAHANSERNNGLTLDNENSHSIFDSQASVHGNVNLCGGTLELRSDLLFNNITTIQSLGTIVGNKHAIELCESINTLPKNTKMFSNSIVRLKNDLEIFSAIIFQGNCVIYGNGNMLTGSENGACIIDKNSTLELRNVVLNQNSNEIIKSLDNSGKLILRDCTLPNNMSYQIKAGTIQIINSQTNLKKLEGKELSGNNDEIFLDGVNINEFVYKKKDDSTNDVLQKRINKLEHSREHFKNRIQELVELQREQTSHYDDLSERILTIETVVDALYVREPELLDCCQDIESRVAQLETCCEQTQSNLDECCSAFEECCSAMEICCSQMEDCCNMLRTSTGFLQSQIDACCNMTSTGTCYILITGDVFYNPNLFPQMAPKANQAVIFLFDECVGANNIPRLIFDRAVYDPLNINNGVINIPFNGQFIFKGVGIAELRSTGAFNLQGSLFIANSKPNLIAEDNAVIHLGDDGRQATWAIQGTGRYISRINASLLLDQPNSQLVIGDPVTNLDANIETTVIGASQFIINHPTAFLSYQNSLHDIVFDNQSGLSVLQGTVELNTNRGIFAPGEVRTLQFSEGSSLQVRQVSPYPVFAMAPNLDNAPVNFDNKTGVVYGNGNLRFRSFDADNVDTTLLLQSSFFTATRTMVLQFMQLAYVNANTLAVQDPTDFSILVRLGSLPDVTLLGNLAALKPTRNGSVQILQQNDHDVSYRGNIITGYDQNGIPFDINPAGVRTNV